MKLNKIIVLLLLTLISPFRIFANADLSIAPGTFVSIHTNRNLNHNPHVYEPGHDLLSQRLLPLYLQANMILGGPEYVWNNIFLEDDRNDFLQFLSNCSYQIDDDLISEYLSEYLFIWLEHYCTSTLPVRSFILGERWEAEVGEILVVSNSKVIYKAPDEECLSDEHIIISHKSFWGTVDLAFSVSTNNSNGGIEIDSTAINTVSGRKLGYPIPTLTSGAIIPFILCEDSGLLPIDDIQVSLTRSSRKPARSTKPRMVPWPGPHLSHKPTFPPSLVDIVKGKTKVSWSDMRWTPIYPVVDKGMEHVHLADSGVRVEISSELSAKIAGDFPEFGSGSAGASFKAGTTITLNEEAFYTQYTINVSKWKYTWKATNIDGKPDWKLVKIGKLVGQPKGREYHPKWYAAKDGWRPDPIGTTKKRYWRWIPPGYVYRTEIVLGRWPIISSPPNVLWKSSLWISNEWNVYYGEG